MVRARRAGLLVLLAVALVVPTATGPTRTAEAASRAGSAVAGLLEPATALLAPAYDAAAGVRLRSLGTALQSRALSRPDLADVTVDELTGWGYVDDPAMHVTVWVEGDRFLVRARDVRPGASTLQLSSDDLAVRSLPRADGVADTDARSGLRVVPAVLPGR